MFIQSSSYNTAAGSLARIWFLILYTVGIQFVIHFTGSRQPETCAMSSKAMLKSWRTECNSVSTVAPLFSEFQGLFYSYLMSICFPLPLPGETEKTELKYLEKQHMTQFEVWFSNRNWILKPALLRDIVIISVVGVKGKLPDQFPSKDDVMVHVGYSCVV